MENSKATPEKSKTQAPWPFYVKLGVMMILVFFASIGYFRSNFLDQDHFPEVASDVEADVEEDTGTFAEANQRKQIKDIKLVGEDGTESHISKYKNKVVILSFWASWCAPCLDELPTFAKLLKEFGEKDLAVVPVNVEDETVDKSFVSSFWKKNEIPFPTFYDPKQISAQAMDVQVMPTNFVIDRKGRVACASYGANDWSGKKALTFIKSLIKENN